MARLDLFSTVAHWFVRRSPLGKAFLGLFVIVLLTELCCRRFAPHSRFFLAWTSLFRRVGEIWTGAILSVVYVLVVGPIGLITRWRGQDLLDRRPAEGHTAWRPHAPNPLGPEAAARHQF